MPRPASHAVALGPTYRRVTGKRGPRRQREPVPPALREPDGARRDRLPVNAPGRFLTPWSWGHLFDVAGSRSVVVDNFGAMGNRIAFENALASILAVDEETTAGFCRQNGIRFIVLDNPLRLISRYAETLGRSPAAYLRPAPDPDAPMRVTRLAQASFWWRAYFLRGAGRPEAGRFGLPFRHFRLVWVDSDPAPEPPPYAGPAVQIWELAD